LREGAFPFEFFDLVRLKLTGVFFEILTGLAALMPLLEFHERSAEAPPS
jgi:hypothetical protein